MVDLTYFHFSIRMRLIWQINLLIVTLQSTTSFLNYIKDKILFLPKVSIKKGGLFASVMVGKGRHAFFLKVTLHVVINSLTELRVGNNNQ